MTKPNPTLDFAALICPKHGRVGLNEDQYRSCLARPHERWKCPICGSKATFDDEYWDEAHPFDDDDDDEEEE
jgi:hypothetical protein